MLKFTCSPNTVVRLHLAKTPKKFITIGFVFPSDYDVLRFKPLYFVRMPYISPFDPNSEPDYKCGSINHTIMADMSTYPMCIDRSSIIAWELYRLIPGEARNYNTVNYCDVTEEKLVLFGKDGYCLEKK